MVNTRSTTMSHVTAYVHTDIWYAAGKHKIHHGLALPVWQGIIFVPDDETHVRQVLG